MERSLPKVRVDQGQNYGASRTISRKLPSLNPPTAWTLLPLPLSAFTLSPEGKPMECSFTPATFSQVFDEKQNYPFLCTNLKPQSTPEDLVSGNFANSK